MKSSFALFTHLTDQVIMICQIPRSGEEKTQPSCLKSSIQWEPQTKTDYYTHIMSWAIPSTSIQEEWLRRDLTETGHQLTSDIHSPLHFSGRIPPL